MRRHAGWLQEAAACLEYPRAGLARRAHGAAEAAPTPALTETLCELAEYLDLTPLGAQQERYTALFDLDACCTLHAGYHLFGDAYERGALLAGLNGELRRAGIDPAPELPDHLAVLLRLLGQLEPTDAEDLRSRLLAPALGVMSERLAKVDHPWTRLVRAYGAWLGAVAREADQQPKARPQQEFLRA